MNDGIKWTNIASTEKLFSFGRNLKMKSMVKGGIWKNSEDEILKAAVMKYGLNHWSRIASLLVRKTPSQCKTRWYEWLDPSVKKTEWSREEDEKLLHLAKIFPTQWRTIAPVVGRTAHQCQERYDKLLDEAQGRDTMDENDPRRLRPGEIDPNPETRPAKADPVDMDDDEKQMLQEARARLANVRGKKANRKAREKVMDETRRLAELQKDRELRAAGLSSSHRRVKRGEIDYTKEIPFETQPLRGVHAFGAEEEPRASISLQNLTLQQLEGKTRMDEEKKFRKEDKRIIKKLKEREMPAAALAAEEEASLAFRKINKLVLPDVQDSDDESGKDGDSTPSYSGDSEESPVSRRAPGQKLNARSLLSQLPAAENEVEIDAPDMPDEIEEDQDVDMMHGGPDGRSVEEGRWRSSAVVQRNLLRPVTIVDMNSGAIRSLILAEANQLLQADALEHPVKGHRPNASVPAADRSEFSLQELKSADALIAQRMGGATAEAGSVDIPVPVFTRDVETRLHKSVEKDRARAQEMRGTAEAILAQDESSIERIDDEMRAVSAELAFVTRGVRVMQLVAPKEEAEGESRLEELRELVAKEKLKNKQLQEKFLRLNSFIKVLTNVSL